MKILLKHFLRRQVKILKNCSLKIFMAIWEFHGENGNPLERQLEWDGMRIRVHIHITKNVRRNM